MPVRIYIDTEVLGPTRVIDGVEHRELIARVATALEDSDVPTEDELSLLQPWLWRQLLWRTVINGQADHSPTPLPLPEHAPDPAALLPGIVARFPRTDDAESSFFWVVRPDEQEEDPDGADRIHWPEVLADMAQWPGPLPYRCGVCWAFAIPAAELPDNQHVFLTLDSLSIGDGPALQFGARTIVEDVLSSESADAGLVLSVRGGRAPGEPEAGQILDLRRLLVRRHEGTKQRGFDWQQGVADGLADALNPAALIPGVLARTWEQVAPDHDAKIQAVEAARDSHRQLLRHLLRPGLDGDPGWGWLLDLANEVPVSDNDDSPAQAALREAARDCAAALRSMGTELAEDVIDTILATAGTDDPPWPDPALPPGEFQQDLDQALQSRLGDLGVLDLPLRVLLTQSPSQELAASIGQIRHWIAQFSVNDPTAQNALQRQPPSAARALLRAWLATPFAQDEVTTTPWLLYLDRVAELAQAHPTADEWTLYTKPFSTGHEDGSALGDLAAHTCGGQGLRLPPHWVPACTQVLRDAFVEPADASQLGDQTQDLVLSVDRPGSVSLDPEADLSSRVAGYVGLVRQRLGENQSRWYPLNLARASIEFQPDDAAANSVLDLGLVLAPLPICYVEGQRRLLQVFDGSAWVDDARDQALTSDYGDNGTVPRTLGLWVHLGLPPDHPLPTLKDGVAYDFALLLVGAGNSLHPTLRGPSGHPADLDPDRLTRIDDGPGGTPVHGQEIHTLRASRTLRVAAPTLRSGDVDAWFDSRHTPVVPLAHEWIRTLRDERATLPEPAPTDLRSWSDAPLTLLVPNPGWNGATTREFEIQPPQIGQNAWLRWWDRERLERGEDLNGPVETRIRAGLRMALKMAESAPDRAADAVQTEFNQPGFDDPAVTGLVVRWRCLFPLEDAGNQGQLFVPLIDRYAEEPKPEDSDLLGLAAMRPLTRPRLRLHVDETMEGLERTFDDVDMHCRKGHVYALAIHAAVPETYFADVTDAERRFAAASPELETVDGRRLFAPTRVLIEVATDAMISSATLWDCLHVESDATKLQVGLRYQQSSRLEYWNRFQLRTQRWNWRGRPVPTPSDDAPNTRPWLDWVDAMFDGRSDQDVQEIERFGTANAGETRLFERSLADDDRADLWRFGLTAESRYSSIAPQPLRVEARGSLISDDAPPTDGDVPRPGRLDRFKPLEIRQRGERPMPKPKVRICLPLMREVPVADGAIAYRLAFLVELDESWHLEAGPAERLVAEVLTTPHYAQVDDSHPELVPEIGPVPTVGGERWPATEAPLQTLAVFGQTLDPDSGAARYGRASAVVTLAGSAGGDLAQRWNQGSLMLKVRFGRRIDGRLSELREAEVDDWSAAFWIELPPPSRRVGPYGLHELSLSFDGDDVRLCTAADGQPLQLSASQMARPFAWLVLTEQVHDARGQLGSERLVDVQLLEADRDAPAWSAGNRPRNHLRAYLYWLEPQRQTSDAGTSDWLRPAKTGIEALDDLFETTRHGDARVRVVQMTQAIGARP